MVQFVAAYVHLLKAARQIPTVPKRANEQQLRLFQAVTERDAQRLDAGYLPPPESVERLARLVGVPRRDCVDAIESFLIWRRKCLPRAERDAADQDNEAEYSD